MMNKTLKLSEQFIYIYLFRFARVAVYRYIVYLYVDDMQSC